jgi:multiple sugar transport system permease protein
MTVLTPNQTSAGKPPVLHRRRKPLATRAYKAFRVAALIAVVLFLIAPLFWMLLASFKTNVDIYDTGKALFFSPTGENYANVLQRNNYFVFIFNSFWVAFVSTALSIVLGVPAAYAMSRFTMHRSALVVLMARVIPGVSLLVPWYYVFSNLRMVGRFEVLILSHMFVALPLIVYIMMSYFDSLPLELEESAQVDGLTPIGASAASRCRSRLPESPRPASSRSSFPGTTSCLPWCSPAPAPRRCPWPSSTLSPTPASTGAG